PRPLSNAIFPRKISGIHPSTGMTILPADLSGDTQVDFESFWFTPYAELSEAVGTELRLFQDPFTRSTAGYISRPWINLSGNEVWVSSSGWAGVPTGVFISGGGRLALYDTPLSTDRVQVSARVVEAVSPTTTSFSFVALRTTNNMGIGVGVFFNASTIQIRSWMAAGPSTVHTLSTVRASTPWALGTAREFTATWENGEVAVYDESNTAILSWTDTVTQKVPRYRFVGIGFNLADGVSSPRLDH